MHDLTHHEGAILQEVIEDPGLCCEARSGNPFNVLLLQSTSDLVLRIAGCDGVESGRSRIGRGSSGFCVG